LNLEELTRAVDLQKKGYVLLRWLAGAIDRGDVALEQMHDTLSIETAARAWVRANHGVFPRDTRVDETDLEAFANLFASYLVTSFDLVATPPRRKETRCCFCPLCSIFVSLSHLQPKKLTEVDKHRARRLELAYLRDRGADPSCIDAIVDDETLREPLALATYGRELVKRLEGRYEGAEVLVLWRRFAWTRTGSPKKDFELTAEAIVSAETMVADRIRASTPSP
jgi:hypothetical protein